MGSLRTDPQTAGDRKARRYLSDVGNHQPRTPPFSPSRQTNLFRGGRGFSISRMLRHHKRRHLVVVMDQAPPHVSKRTKQYIASQQRLRRASICAKYSPDWKSRREGMESPQASRAKRAPSEDKRRPGATGRTGSSNACRKTEGYYRACFFRCCVAETFGMSHTYGRRH